MTGTGCEMRHNTKARARDRFSRATVFTFHNIRINTFVKFNIFYCSQFRSARDPFAGYRGEKKVIWDDARFSGTDVSELLRLLDPYNRQRIVGARYHDKKLNAVEEMYITAIEPPHHLWDKAFPDEDYKQFRRRLADVYHVNDDGTYEIESTRELKNLPWVQQSPDVDPTGKNQD